MNLVTSLKERGHECLVIAERRNPRDEGPGFYDGTPVHGISFRTAAANGDLPAIRLKHELCARLIGEFDPDVIHLHPVMRGALGFVLTQRNCRRPAILTLHDNVLFQHRHGLGGSVFENVDAIAAVSQSIQTATLKYDPGLKNKLHTVLNSLPMPKLAPAPFPTEPRLLAFGRLVKVKGFDLAIQAFARLARLFPQATLTVAGHGPEHASLGHLARESGFASRIHFPGWVHPDEIPALINQHSIVIMPSRWQEPFGLVALQTAQMGRPIVASRTGGIPEIVSDRVTGKLYENENLPALTEAIQLLLENPGLAEQMGRAAHLHAQKQFPFDAFITAYENLYAVHSKTL